MSAPSRFSLRGLTPELFLVVVLPLSALLLLVTFGGVTLHQQSMRQMVGERDQRAAQAAAHALSEQLYHRLSAVQGLAQRAGSADPAELSTILKDVAFLSPDFDGGLAFYDSGGQHLASTPGMQGVNAVLDVSQISSDGQARLSPVYEAETGQVVWAAARNPVSGVIAVGVFSPQKMIEHLLADIVDPNAGGQVFLVDANRQVIYQLGAGLDAGEIAAHPGITEALAGRSGSLFISDHHEHVTAYSPVALGAWALVIEEPWHSVSSPTLRLTEYAPLVLLPVVIVSLAALWFGTYRIVRPLKALQGRAARLGWGDYTAINQPVGGISEIRQLQDELAHLARKVQAAQQGLRDYISAMTAGQEDERRRLARELHDDTLQALIALNQRVQLLQMRLNGAAAGAGHASEIVTEVDSLHVLVDGTIQDLRRLTRALRPIYLEDLGLAPALEMLAKEMSQPDLAISFQCTGPVERLDPPVELALYRMTQEALSNVRKHARASQAKVVVVFDADTIYVQVSDNGGGFVPPVSPAAFAQEGHFGLLGLHERAEMIGATLEIQSQPGEGTRVTIRLPRQA